MGVKGKRVNLNRVGLSSSPAGWERYISNHHARNRKMTAIAYYLELLSSRICSRNDNVVKANIS